MSHDTDGRQATGARSESNPALDKAGIQLYQSKVGAILWSAMGSWPEVQFATTWCTKSPLTGDMLTLDRVLEYLVNSPELGLVLGGTSERLTSEWALARF